MDNLEKIYRTMFDVLRNISVENCFFKEVEARRAKSYEDSKMRGDDYLFDCMVKCIHAAGFRASILEGKWNAIEEAFSQYRINKVASYTEQDI